MEVAEAESAGFPSVLWLPWVMFHHSANSGSNGKEAASNSCSQGLSRSKSMEKIKCYQWSQIGREIDCVHFCKKSRESCTLNILCFYFPTL